MTIAPKLQDFLASRQVAYDVVSHPRTGCSSAAAQAAHVPGRQLAKAVVVEDDRGYVLAVLPSTHHVALSDLGKALHRSGMHLATEEELARLFPDCDLGALPLTGQAYGMPVIVDEALDAQPEIWFEAGDHLHMVPMTGDEFYRLTADAPRAHFSRMDPGLCRIGGGDVA
jgi:Ala-tRNA(Pro) deacylase